MEFGEAAGLSGSLQYGERINDLRFQQQMLERSKAKAAAAASMFADEFSQAPIGSQYDDPIIKNYSHNKMKEAGALMRNNPDYKYNPEVLSQLKAIRNDIKGNEHVLRAVSFVDAKKRLKDDLAEMAKNPQMHDQEAYQDLLNQVSNYDKYGNQHGELAAQNEGAQQFVYNKPRDFIDINKAFSDVGTKFNDMKVGKLKGGGMGSYEEYANPDSLNAVANQMYSQNQRQFDKLATQKGIDPLKYIEAGINAHIPKKRDFGDYSLVREKAMEDFKVKMARIKAGQESPDTNSYKIDVVDKNHSFVSPELMSTLVDKDSPTFLFDNKNKKKIDLTGSTDAKPTGYNFYPDGNGKDPSLRGKKYAEAYSYIPFSKAVEMGIVNSGDWKWGDDEVSSDYSDNVTIEKKEDKDGKEQKVVKIKVFKPFDVNTSSNAGSFNAKSMTAKQRPLPEENYQGQQPKTVVQNGYTYTLGADGQYH